jgi:hypothetical protein
MDAEEFKRLYDLARHLRHSMGDRDSEPRQEARRLLSDRIKTTHDPFRALSELVDEHYELRVELVGEYRRMNEYTAGEFLNCHPSPRTDKH